MEIDESMPAIDGGSWVGAPSRKFPETGWAQAFGRELRALRLFAGLSQGRLAAYAGISQPSLSRLERGRVAKQLLLVLRIGDALGRTLGGRDAGVLTDDSRRLLDALQALSPGCPPGREPVTGVPGLEEMVRLYHEASQEQRRAILVALRMWSAHARESTI